MEAKSSSPGRGELAEVTARCFVTAVSAAVNEHIQPGSCHATLGGCRAHSAFELAPPSACSEQKHRTQKRLAGAAGMTQSAIARFEAGGTTPTIPVLNRIAHALDADLAVRITARTDVA